MLTLILMQFISLPLGQGLHDQDVAQARNYVEQYIDQLDAHFPEIEFEIVIIKTTGDRDQKSSLTKIGGRGVFTKTIEEALSAGSIDMAVHSLKDLPSQQPDDLCLAAVPKRGAVEDVLVSENGVDLNALPMNAEVATGSIRRRSQLLAIRPDLQIRDLRGNIHTRLQKLKTENWDAIVMARAAIERLQLDTVRYAVLSVDQMVPAVSQGAIGVQSRAQDADLLAMLKKLNHQPTFQAILAERAVLRRLDSGCQFPVGALAHVDEHEQLSIHAFVADSLGQKIIKKMKKGLAVNAEKIGQDLADELIADGALDLLKSFQQNVD